MTRPLALVVAAGILTAAALLAAPAQAESAPVPPRCGARILPSDGTGPVSLPAFVVEDSSSPGLVVTAAAPVVTPSLDIDVVPDPREPKVTLWVPRAGSKLEIGTTHAFAFGLRCSDASKSGPDQGTFTFKGTGAVALPTSIGTTRELADGRAVITPSAELAAFLPVTHFEVSLDGKPVGTIRYGVVSGAELEVSLQRNYVGIGDAITQPDGSVALCAGATTGIEKHQVTVLAHVAGAATDPPAITLSSSIDCTIAPSTVTLPDGGGDDRGASGGADDGGGCAVSGGGPASGLVVFFGIGAALAAALRKRRQRRQG